MAQRMFSSFALLLTAMNISAPVFADDNDFVTTTAGRNNIGVDAPYVPPAPPAPPAPQAAHNPYSSAQAHAPEQAYAPAEPEIPPGWVRPEDASVTIGQNRFGGGYNAGVNTGGLGVGIAGLGNTANMPNQAINLALQGVAMEENGTLTDAKDQALQAAFLGSLMQYISSQPNTPMPTNLAINNNTLSSGGAAYGARFTNNTGNRSAVAAARSRATPASGVAVNCASGARPAGGVQMTSAGCR